MSIANIKRKIAQLYIIFGGLQNRLLRYFMLSLIPEKGNNIKFDARDPISYNKLVLGSNIYIGKGAKISSAISKIYIGNNVMFGPNVLIRGGNHNTSVLGKFMFDVHSKRPEDDEDVIIEEDVWVGANVTILKGSIIRRGSIVAAGAVVNRDFPPYSIIGGVPARVLKKRFSYDDVVTHESSLYDPKKRITEKEYYGD